MKLKVDYLSRCIVLLLALLAFGNFALAQRTVTGTVTDAENGEPLIGANVLVVGTGTGTVTDFDGNYEVQVPEGNDMLEFSYTGYTSQQVAIAGRSEVDVTLSAGQELEEVVVVGYGTQKSKEVTSAITSVKEEDFNKGNVTNPAQLLQGKVAGLSISRPGANPNGGFNIRLRGLSTVGANTQPLVVIDGIIGADLSTVDPNDIASIDVLKDGSAAAIYGTRGASGVILITTKKGKEGTAQIDYNGFVTADIVTNTVDVLSADEYRNFAGGSNGDLTGTDLGSNTDWFDEITQTGISQTHNLSLSGGSASTSYRVSMNYRDNEGTAVNTGFEQLNARINLQQKALNDRLRVTFNVSGTTRDEQRGFDQAFRYATIYNPTAPIRDDKPEFDIYDGYFQQVLFDYFNPVAILEQNRNDAERKLVLANIRGDYEIIDGLTISANYSVERTNEIEGRYYDRNSFWVGRDRNGQAEVRNDESQTELFQSTAEYVQEFGGLTFKALGGYEFQEFTFQGSGINNGNFLTDAFSFHNIGAGLDDDNGLAGIFTYKNNYRLIAFFGRVNFNFQDNYFLTASLRREGSSRFGEGNQWGWFPAVSGGVTLSNLLDIPGVDNLKIRGGYGVTGNIPGESYLALQRFGSTGNFLVNGQWVPRFGPVSNPNPDLKWETKEDISVGVDFAFMDYKLTGSLDFYTTTTNDLILPFDVPSPPNLFSSTFVNVGELQNTGLEAVFNYNVVSTPDFTWTTSLNGTWYITNDIVSLSTDDFDFGGVRDIANLGSPGQNGTPLIRIEEGAPIGQIWGLEYVGVSEDGQWIHADTNGDGTVDDQEDRTVIGGGLPDGQLGWNNTFTFGNFDFSFFIDGVFGHDLVNTFRAFYEAPEAINSYNILSSTVGSDVQRLAAAPKFSSLHVEDASFIRLNNTTLGYSFDMPAGGSFRKLRLYVTGERLFYITDYLGVDPEPRFSDGGGTFGPLAPGIDRRNTWYRTAAVTFGLQFGF